MQYDPARTTPRGTMLSIFGEIIKTLLLCVSLRKILLVSTLQRLLLPTISDYQVSISDSRFSSSLEILRSLFIICKAIKINCFYCLTNCKKIDSNLYPWRYRK